MNENDMMLGRDWDCTCNLAGWHLSEKLHGCHDYWDGRRFWTRRGNIVRNVPERILSAMPRVHLDGEMFAGYGQFEAARLAVECGIWTDSVEFVCFDMPQADGDWSNRIALASAFYPHIVKHWIAQSSQHAVDLMFDVCAAGGEGLMAAKPGATYQPGRTNFLRKLKPAFVNTVPSWMQSMDFTFDSQ
jgi:ATP-dependent DNA ligase